MIHSTSGRARRSMAGNVTERVSRPLSVGKMTEYFGVVEKTFKVTQTTILKNGENGENGFKRCGNGNPSPRNSLRPMRSEAIIMCSCVHLHPNGTKCRLFFKWVN